MHLDAHDSLNLVVILIKRVIAWIDKVYNKSVCEKTAGSVSPMATNQ